MARRAGRISSSRATGLRKRAENSIAAQEERKIRRSLARSIQEFAVTSMNELAQKGPAWSGEFSASWGFAPKGAAPDTPGTTGQVYRYTKNDVNLYTVERYLKNGTTDFSITNTSEHANEAIDGTKAIFTRPPWGPVKEESLELGTGREQPSLRYEIGANFDGRLKDAPAARTAEPDWYVTYLLGGGLQKNLSYGVSIGFSTSF
jgi:hypothetical protein